MPGITITGRLPLRVRAEAKMCSRFGVRLAEMQAVETIDTATRTVMRGWDFDVVLFSRRFPTSIDQTGHEACAEAVIDVHDRDV